MLAASPVGCYTVNLVSSVPGVVVGIRTAEASATRARMARMMLGMGERMLEYFSVSLRILMVLMMKCREL